jgi:hypothetical protein
MLAAARIFNISLRRKRTYGRFTSRADEILVEDWIGVGVG